MITGLELHPSETQATYSSVLITMGGSSHVELAHQLPVPWKKMCLLGANDPHGLYSLKQLNFSQKPRSGIQRNRWECKLCRSTRMCRLVAPHCHHLLLHALSWAFIQWAQRSAGDSNIGICNQEHTEFMMKGRVLTMSNWIWSESHCRSLFSMCKTFAEDEAELVDIGLFVIRTACLPYMVWALTISFECLKTFELLPSPPPF